MRLKVSQSTSPHARPPMLKVFHAKGPPGQRHWPSGPRNLHPSLYSAHPALIDSSGPRNLHPSLDSAHATLDPEICTRPLTAPTPHWFTQADPENCIALIQCSHHIDWPKWFNKVLTSMHCTSIWDTPIDFKTLYIVIAIAKTQWNIKEMLHIDAKMMILHWFYQVWWPMCCTTIWTTPINLKTPDVPIVKNHTKLQWNLKKMLYTIALVGAQC